MEDDYIVCAQVALPGFRISPAPILRDCSVEARGKTLLGRSCETQCSVFLLRISGLHACMHARIGSTPHPSALTLCAPPVAAFDWRLLRGSGVLALRLHPAMLP
jgi:hypothetical protein